MKANRDPVGKRATNDQKATLLIPVFENTNFNLVN